MKTLAIYLAGTIKKQHEINDYDWSAEDIDVLQKSLADYDISFLNPAKRNDDLTDQKSVFGRDMLQVMSSDVVFVDARAKRGLGVGAEMLWAKVRSIPVVTLAPKNSHYNRDSTSLLDVTVNNWIHPFVESLSDKVAHDLVEGCEWIKNMLENPTPTIKNIDFVFEAISHYKQTQLKRDDAMRDFLEAHQKLNSRIINL